MRRGQMLVEIIIAFAIAMIALVALVQVATRSIANAGAAKREAQATAWAIRSNEWVNDQKSVDWDAFKSTHGSGTYCFNDTATPITLTPSGTACQVESSEYQRLVTIDYPAIVPGKQSMTVLSTVSWNEGGRTVSSKQSAEYTRY